MKQRRNQLIIFFGVLMAIIGCGFLSSNGFAQDIDLFLPEFFSLKHMTIGMGAGLAPDYEGADDFKAIPVPQFRYNFTNGRYVNWLGPSLHVSLIPDRIYGFGPMLRYRPERDSVDDDVVDKLRKVDSAAEAGVFGSALINNFLFYVACNKDITDSHEGYLIDAAGGYRAGIETNVQVILQAIGTYASDDYMETYFGIDKDNSDQSGLPEYRAKAGVKDFGLLAALQYKIDSNWAIMGIMKYTRLIGDAADSPIVDDRGDANNFMDAIIVNYSF
jgi:outer membrane protein